MLMASLRQLARVPRLASTISATAAAAAVAVVSGSLAVVPTRMESAHLDGADAVDRVLAIEPGAEEEEEAEEEETETGGSSKSVYSQQETGQQYTFVGMVKALWKVAKKHLGWLLLSAVMAAGVVAVNMTFPSTLSGLIDAISGGESLVNPLLRLAALLGLDVVVSFLYNLVIDHTHHRIVSQLRTDAFQALMNQDIAYFDGRNVSLVRLLAEDIEAAANAVVGTVQTVVEGISGTVGNVVHMVLIAPKLSLASLLLLPSVWMIVTLMEKLVIQPREQYRKLATELATEASDFLDNIETIKAFNLQEVSVSKYRTSVRHTQQMGEWLGLGSSTFNVIVDLTSSAFIVALIQSGSSLSGGQLTSFLLHMASVSGSGGQLLGFAGKFATGGSAACRLEELFEEIPRIEQSLRTAAVVPSANDDLVHRIEFQHVRFQYPSRSDPIFDDLTVSIPIGAVTAIVGPSGSGKSSLIALLERFYDPQDGSIRIYTGEHAEGIDLRRVQLQWVRNRLGLVPQEPILFDMSVEENLRLGNPGASNEDVEAALQKANALFVYRLEQGLNTSVGAHGSELSAGQKQRLALARAFLKHPTILVLDEATSALDAENEALITEAALTHPTVIIVAHRLSTVKQADNIIVLNQGRVVEQGSHTELMKRNGVYAAMVRQQQLGAEEDNVAGSE